MKSLDIDSDELENWKNLEVTKEFIKYLEDRSGNILRKLLDLGISADIGLKFCLLQGELKTVSEILLELQSTTKGSEN